jgi:hypothetical protein
MTVLSCVCVELLVWLLGVVLPKFDAGCCCDAPACHGSSRDVLYVRGNNFGVNPDQYSIPGVARDGPAGFAKPVIHVCDHRLPNLCDECVRMAYNHTFIACSVPPGVGADKFIRVVVDGLVSDPSEPGAQFAYHAPVITSLSSYSANTGASSTGEQQYITITGQHFGSPAEQAGITSASPTIITMLSYVGPYRPLCGLESTGVAGLAARHSYMHTHPLARMRTCTHTIACPPLLAAWLSPPSDVPRQPLCG